jgi:hypothetical protein
VCGILQKGYQHSENLPTTRGLQKTAKPGACHTKIASRRERERERERDRMSGGKTDELVQEYRPLHRLIS